MKFFEHIPPNEYESEAERGKIVRYRRIAVALGCITVGAGFIGLGLAERGSNAEAASIVAATLGTYATITPLWAELSERLAHRDDEEDGEDDGDGPPDDGPPEEPPQLPPSPGLKRHWIEDVEDYLRNQPMMNVDYL